MVDIEAKFVEKGFPVQKDTLTALAIGYAKVGDVENLNRTLTRFDEEDLILLNKDLLAIMFELHQSGNAIEPIADRLQKGHDFKSALESIVTKALRCSGNGFVHKLLTISNENERMVLAKIFMESSVNTSEQQTDDAIKMLAEFGITMKSHPSIFIACLESNSPQLIRSTLKDMMAGSVQIEPKHFRKLIELANDNGVDAILDVIRLMQSEYGVQPDMRLYRDVILPRLNAKDDPFLAFARIRSVTTRTNAFVARSLYLRCLMDGNIKAAFEIANDFRSYFRGMDQYRSQLINAFLNTDDAQLFAKIVNILRFNMERTDAPLNISGLADVDIRGDPRKLVDELLNGALKKVGQYPHKIQHLLQAFVDERLSISKPMATTIRNDLDHVLSDSDINALNTLSSGDLTPTELGEKRKSPQTLGLLSSDELEKMVGKQNDQREENIVKKYLLAAYVNENKVGKVEESLRTHKHSCDNWNKMFNMHLRNGDATKTLHVFYEARKLKPDYGVLRISVINLAYLMLAEKRDWDEISQFIVDNKDRKPAPSNGPAGIRWLRKCVETISSTEFERLMNALEENHILIKDKTVQDMFLAAYINDNDGEKAEKFLETLEPQAGNYKSMINMHIANGDVTKALDVLHEARRLIPDYELLRVQVIDLAYLMIKEVRDWDEIAQFIVDNKNCARPSTNDMASIKSLRKYAVTTESTQFEKLINALTLNHMLINDNNVRGTLITNLVEQQHLSQAVRLFEQNYAETKGITGRFFLMKALIKAGDAVTLKSIFDKILEVKPVWIATFSLVQCYIEADEVQNARDILQRFWDRSAQKNLLSEGCKYLFIAQNIPALEGFLEASVGLRYERQNIFEYLLSLYCNDGRTEQALGLYHKQIDEGVEPSREFYMQLQSYLEDKGIEVPFTKIRKTYPSSSTAARTDNKWNEKRDNRSLEQSTTKKQ